MEIYVYKINGNEINDSIFKSYLDKLDLKKKKQIINYKNDIDKSRSLIAHILVYLYFDGNIEYGYSEYGKITHNKSNKKFNISHSENYVIVAFCKDEIGIDIEKKREFSTEELKSFCTNEELNNFKHHDYTELWCLKESYLKYIGKGLNNSIINNIFLINNGKIKLLSNPKLYFQMIDIDYEYVCCVVTDDFCKAKIISVTETDIKNKIIS